MSGGLGGVGGAGQVRPYGEGVERELRIAGFPDEVFEQILACLTPEAAESAASVNSFWKGITINVIAREQFPGIQNFANFLSENLPSGDRGINEEQRQMLLKSGSDRKIFDSNNLIEVKSSIVEAREKILTVLKQLEHDVLTGLEHAVLTNLERNDKERVFFFENIFDIARDYLVEEASQGVFLEGFLLDVSQELVKVGFLDKAIKYASKMTSKDGKRLLRSIYRDLAKQGYFDEAIASLNKISFEDVEKERALKYVKEAKAEKSGDIEKALEIAEAMLHKDDRSNAFARLSLEIAKAGGLDRAREIADLIPYPYLKMAAFKEISALETGA